ncbi:hypothetical protein [Chryseobacterium shigense]|uniref:Uncharacterized protein n=1 Tax=Chryseobacterium shigense TaxID=297244 RepID=A0A841NIR8_9FLAO|nr:hypothetical protein [Chryseobacterium shigense]MBB6371149.1 hypothetical protein [Chryseobacterium shigense]
MNSSTAPSSGQTLGVDASGNVITIPNAATASVSTQEVSIGGSGPAQSSNKFDVNDTGWTTVKNSNQTVIVPAGGRAVFINFMLGIDYISNPPGGGGGYYTAKLYIDGVATNVFLTAQEPTYGAQAQFSLSTVKALTEGSHTIEVRMSRTYNNGTTAGAEMTCAMMSMSLNSSYIN